MTRVMVVEDQSSTRDLLKTLLELEGFLVSACNEQDEQKIVQLILDQNPEIVIMDVHMRKISGIDVLSTIKGMVTASPRFLMISGMPLWAECKKAGADDFLIKPFMPDELIDKVNRLVRKQDDVA